MHGADGGFSQSPTPTARSQGADKNSGVGGVALHPYPVAEQSAAGKGTGGVDGDNPDSHVLLAEGADEIIYQGDFTDTRGTGDADDESLAGVGIKLLYLPDSLRRLVFQKGNKSGGGPDITFQYFSGKVHST